MEIPKSTKYIAADLMGHPLLLFSISLTIKIVDFEEKENLVVHTFSRELVHCLDKLRDADSAAAVGVKDAEGPLHEKWLKS